MSRDTLVRRFDPNSVSETDKPYERPAVPEGLGTTAELHAAISRVLPGANWFKEDSPATQEATESASMPLGTIDEVKAAISKVLPEVDWSEPGWGFYERDGICLEFNLEEDDPVEALMIKIRSGNPGAELLALANATNWSFFDPTHGKYLNADA